MGRRELTDPSRTRRHSVPSHSSSHPSVTHHHPWIHPAEASLAEHHHLLLGHAVHHHLLLLLLELMVLVELVELVLLRVHLLLLLLLVHLQKRKYTWFSRDALSRGQGEEGQGRRESRRTIPMFSTIPSISLLLLTYSTHVNSSNP
jgi:hypothetical protein